jgi:hypothetical protein
MTNWKEYIENFFNLLNVNFEKKANGNLHPTITYFINGIYIQFDFLNSTHLNKIEIGKEIGNFRSNYKIIFDQLKPKNFLVKQNCWEIDTKTSCQLEFNEINSGKISGFLKLLIEKGWTEKLYEYGGTEYKNELIIENQHLLISLKSDMEQDIPFLFDSILRKIEDIWFDINLKSKKKIIVNIIEPLKNNIA